MEVPLVLRAGSGGKLAYTVSGAYRAIMGAILAIVAAALATAGAVPGPVGWAAMAVAALACLYEERWTFDPAAGRIVHRAGLVFLARRTTIAIVDVMRFSITPFVRGTLPGSADEAAQNAAALAGARGDDGGVRRAVHKKPYLCLVCEAADGSRYFVNAIPARKGESLKKQASAIAEACGKELSQG